MRRGKLGLWPCLLPCLLACRAHRGAAAALEDTALQKHLSECGTPRPSTSARKLSVLDKAFLQNEGSRALFEVSLDWQAAGVGIETFSASEGLVQHSFSDWAGLAGADVGRLLTFSVSCAGHVVPAAAHHAANSTHVRTQAPQQCSRGGDGTTVQLLVSTPGCAWTEVPEPMKGPVRQQQQQEQQQQQQRAEGEAPSRVMRFIATETGACVCETFSLPLHFSPPSTDASSADSDSASKGAAEATSHSPATSSSRSSKRAKGLVIVPEDADLDSSSPSSSSPAARSATLSDLSLLIGTELGGGEEDAVTPSLPPGLLRPQAHLLTSPLQQQTRAQAAPASARVGGSGNATGAPAISSPFSSPEAFLEVTSSLYSSSSSSSRSLSSFPIPGLMNILQIFMQVLLPPLFNPVIEMVDDHLEHTISETLGKDVNAVTGKDVVERLEPDLRKRLVNKLPDAITGATAEDVATALTDEVAPGLIEELVQAIGPELEDRLISKLEPRIAGRLDARLPGMLSSSLLRSLVPTLTRSLTHTLVPALGLQLLTSNPQALQQLHVPLSPSCSAVCVQAASPEAAFLRKPKQDCLSCQATELETQLLYHAHAVSSYYSEHQAQYQEKALELLHSALQGVSPQEIRKQGKL